MRILVAGANSQYAIEIPYVKYLREQKGIERVDFFEAQNIFLEYYQRGWIQKIAFRSGLSSIYIQINGRLQELLRKLTPDVLLVFKGMEIFPETIRFAKQLGVRTVNYNPDNPFLFTGKGSGNSNITRSIGLYDLHFSYDRVIQQRIENEYRIKCVLLPFGFELDDALFEKCQVETNVNRVCFLGNPDKSRVDFLRQLAEHKIPIDVYGNNWSSWVDKSQIRIYNAVYGDEFWITLRRYRVQLNLMRIHNPNSHNMRTFEIPAVGGIQLAPDTPDHQDFFEPGKEIFLFSNVSECVAQARHLLSLNRNREHVIRINARKRSLASGYRYLNRAEQIYNALKIL